MQEIATNTIYEARIRGKFKLLKTRLTNPLAVGDFVEFELESSDVAWITKIEPRKNYLIRKSVNLSKEAHIIASNIDTACFIFTLKFPETSLGFLDRFLVCCEAYNIQPLILFNKIDTLSAEELELLEDLQQLYQNIGYETLKISSVSGENIETLKNLLKDKVSVFFGHSGSGKSTLVNTLEPTLDLKTGEISEAHLKGKHTTTFAQMHFWSFGGSVIDTPGVREFAMVDIEKEEIQHFFPEIFEEGKNYIQYENGKTYSVFNDHPNCFSHEYIHTFDRKEVGNTLTLIHHIGYYDEEVFYLFEEEGIKNTLQFDLGAYNDFLISYDKLSREKANVVLVPMELEGENGAFFHRGKWPEEELKMVKERLKEVPKEHLKRFFVPKEKSKNISQESISFLYADNIEPPMALLVLKKDGRVVGGSYTSKPFEDEEVRLYLQVKTQGSITDPKQLKVAPKAIFVSECE